MFCTKCGAPLPEGDNFCAHCGQPAPDAPAEAPQSTTPAEPVTEAEQAPAAPKPAPITPESASVTPEPESIKPGNKMRGVVLAVLLSLAVVAILLSVFIVRGIQREKKRIAAVEEGTQCLADGDYATAERCFHQALELSAKDPDAALGLAQTYLCQGEWNEATDLLEKLEGLEADPERAARYQELLSVAKADPEKLSVDTENFPTVTVNLFGVEAGGVDAASIRVVEGGVDRPVTYLSSEGDSVSFSYQTDDVGFASESRDFTYTLKKSGVPLSGGGRYDTPSFEPAQVRLVSTDVSAYPTVKAYFRVEGGAGETVEGLDSRAFIIRERLQGGEYLSREVHAVSSLERQGLNIDLVADKSDSIDNQMFRMKQVMIEFVNSLDYAKGDRAEVLAFDDIVQQMCYYTSDVTLLTNGINNMSTDGMTAFYDAVYKGILNARLQGGARCVIAFTDGMDNRSRYDAQDVINYANTNQVPVYIIGVGTYGYAYEGTLRNIANSTGGRYWNISDLYDLGEIYQEIYAEQQELYVVEYQSDATMDQYATRNLQVTVTGGGYKGNLDVSFTPVVSVGQKTHTSRYELVKGDLTWEEASQRCQEMGGHLATVTSQDEQNQLIAMAEAQGVEFVWLGGYTSYNSYGDVFGHWVTGEDFSYSKWSSGEPSRVDLDGTPEWYIMLWKIQGVWAWNDQRNDPLAIVNAMKGKTGFVCEYES